MSEKNTTKPTGSNWHKRHALSLASQLHENATDAAAVIRALQDLVDTWMYAEAPPKVVSIVRDPAKSDST
jgi:hypothetical protein